MDTRTLPPSASADLPRVSARSRRAAAAAAAAQLLVPMTRTQRLWLLFAFFAYFVGVTTLAILNETRGAGLMIPALGLVLIARAFPLLRAQHTLAWFHPLVFTSAYSLIGLLRSYSSFAFGLDRHIALPGYGPVDLARLVAFEAVLTALGLFCYYIGFLFLPTPRVPRISFRPPRRLPLKVLLAVGASVGTFLLYMRSQGGMRVHMLSWGDSRHVALAGESYWILFTRLGLFACIVWLASDRGVLRKPLFWICAATSLIITFFATGSRAPVVFPIAFGLVVWTLAHGRFSVTRVLSVALIGLFLLSVLGEFRRGTYRGRLDWHVLTDLSPVESIIDMATGELVERATTSDGVLPILARVPQEVDHLWGSSYVAMLVLPVPRTFWEGKPGMVGGQVGSVFFGRQGGVPPGPIGEAYWNFNVAGVAAVYFIFGIFHHWLLRFFLAYRRQPGMVIIYGLTIFLASPATPSVVTFLTALVSVTLLMAIFGMFRLRGRRSPAPVLHGA